MSQITSFQGKRLHEIYGKDNEFHASRRSWYLPISPTPEHPDAGSKKSKKRFPTLKLAGGAALRWASYVNLRHVYRVDWRCLRPYNNPDTPWCSYFGFERESCIRMLAKGRTLTNYEAGPQFQIPMPRPFQGEPYARIDAVDREYVPHFDPRPERRAATFPAESSRSPLAQSDFQVSLQTEDGHIPRPPKAPPDGTTVSGCMNRIPQFILRHVAVWPCVVKQI